MLSILVTYYNQEKYVSRSLDSIFAQKLTTDFEVLIGDDGSTDATVDLIKEYQKKYPQKIKLFIMPREQGKSYNPVERASLNRLNLFQNANGKYLCFLDGDDEYCNYTFMQSAIDFLEMNQKIAGVAHNYVVIKKDGQKEYHEKVLKNKFLTLQGYIKGLYIPAGTMIFRHPGREKILNLFDLKSFDDNDITYFFLNTGKILYNDFNVYNYYSNENSICNSTEEFEFKVLNAIDYEVINRIIDTHHYSLFLRYFGTVWDVFENRILLEKYTKFKSLCIKDGVLDNLYRWNELSQLRKLSIKIDLRFKKTFCDCRNRFMVCNLKKRFFAILKRMVRRVSNDR